MCDIEQSISLLSSAQVSPVTLNRIVKKKKNLLWVGVNKNECSHSPFHMLSVHKFHNPSANTRDRTTLLVGERLFDLFAQYNIIKFNKFRTYFCGWFSELVNNDDGK